MTSLQLSTSTGWTLSVVRLKHTIPSGSGLVEMIGRARLLMDGEMSKGSEREDDEGRADGIAEDGDRRINVNAIRRVCMLCRTLLEIMRSHI